MHDRQSHFGTWNNLMLAAVCAAAVAGVACAASPRSGTNGSGGAAGTSASGGTASGGTHGQGGVSGNGGHTGAGDADAGSGAGGSAGTGGPGTDVDAGAGGSQGPLDGGPDAATPDAAVPSAGCTVDSDCPSGRNCSSGACVLPKACTDSLECGSTDLVCDLDRGLCVQCIRAADCPSGQSCLSNRCASPVKCQTSLDCGQGKVCDPSGRCVECSKDTDCASGQRCVQNACRAACDSDKACTGQGMLCSFDLGVCTQCSAQQPCPTGSYCDGSGLCKLAACLSGESMCVGNGIAACKADGTGFGTVSACPPSRTCTVYGGLASCVELTSSLDAGTASSDGGEAASDGGGSQVVVGPRACGVPFSAAPCTSLPNLLVTQTLDGRGDELCDVPAFHLNADTAKTAGKVLVTNATPPEDATVKVAWSSAGLAVFVDVVDASVQTVNAVAPSQAIDKCYQGDSIELFVASSSDVKGAPGSDSNALHVTIPADGPAVLVKTTTSNGSTTITHSAWTAGQYKQVKTATGYAIEAQLPWPGGAPSTGTLVRFDIGLNSADKTFGSVDDMRDGQLLYYVGAVTSSTCQASDGTVPFCDDRTWCTTLLQ